MLCSLLARLGELYEILNERVVQQTNWCCFYEYFIASGDLNDGTVTRDNWQLHSLALAEGYTCTQTLVLFTLLIKQSSRASFDSTRLARVAHATTTSPLFRKMRVDKYWLTGHYGAHWPDNYWLLRSMFCTQQTHTSIFIYNMRNVMTLWGQTEIGLVT